MDSWLVYVDDAQAFWDRLGAVAAERGAEVHGAPPSVAVELSSDARIYVLQEDVRGDRPDQLVVLGDDVCLMLVSIHNHQIGETFLADVVGGLIAVVDDDDERVESGPFYARRIHARGGDTSSDRPGDGTPRLY